MQHGEEPQSHAQMLGIARDREQRFGGGVEEYVVDGVFVVEGDGGDRLGNGEDHVEVVDRQQFGLALLQPLGACQSLTLGAVPVAAGAVASVRVLAVVAPFDDFAQSRSL